MDIFYPDLRSKRYSNILYNTSSRFDFARSENPAILLRKFNKIRVIEIFYQDSFQNSLL